MIGFVKWIILFWSMLFITFSLFLLNNIKTWSGFSVFLYAIIIGIMLLITFIQIISDEIKDET